MVKAHKKFQGTMNKVILYTVLSESDPACDFWWASQWEKLPTLPAGSK